MDYKKIYNNLIESRRNMNRTKNMIGRYENHHILPVSVGGSDEAFNMVLLTPKEHWIAHLLLLKIVEGQGKYKMEQAIVNMGRVIPELKRKTSILYAKARKAIAVEVSRRHTGTLIVKDAKTGIRIGRVSRDHPRVVSGEWVFFHKGMKRTKERVMKAVECTTGEKNPKWSGYSDDDILKFANSFFEKNGHYEVYDDYINECKKENVPTFFSKNRFKDYSGKNGWHRFLTAYSLAYNIDKNNIFIKDAKKRNQERIKNISKSLVGRKWYYNDTLRLTKQMSKDDINLKNKDWKPGRKTWD